MHIFSSKFACFYLLKRQGLENQKYKQMNVIYEICMIFVLDFDLCALIVHTLGWPDAAR